MNQRSGRGGEHAARALVAMLKTGSAWLTDEGYLFADSLLRVKRPKATTTARTPHSQHEVCQLQLAAYDTRTGPRDLARWGRARSPTAIPEFARERLPARDRIHCPLGLVRLTTRNL